MGVGWGGMIIAQGGTLSACVREMFKGGDWFVLKISRSNTNGVGEIEVTVTSETRTSRKNVETERRRESYIQ